MSSLNLIPSDMIYEETPPIHSYTYTVMRNDSTGQLESGEYLEAASSLSRLGFRVQFMAATGTMPRLLTSLVASLVIYIGE